MAPAQTIARPLPHPGRGIAVISERESLGDGFYKLDLLRGLRRAYPGEKITWIVSEGDSPYRTSMAGIVAPLIDELIVHAHLRRPWLAAIGRLRALPHYGLTIDNRTNNAVVAATRLLLPTDVYQAATPGFLFCRYRPKGPRPEHKLARLMTLLQAATGCPVDGSGEIELPAAASEEAARLLPEGRRYIGMAPGATSAWRRWPLENYIALSRWISAQGWQPVFLLGPIERPALPVLRQAVPEALFPACSESEPQATIELSLALSRRFSAAVGHDTGSSHLMAEAGTPLVTLFGKSKSARWAPNARRGILVQARDHGGRDIELIPLDAVTDALKKLLD
jgi:ADP-heptose:LPS heptosyltransferase